MTNHTPAPQPPECAECYGTGEVFGHADDCHDDLCALNGDMYSCSGKIEPCPCCTPSLQPQETPTILHCSVCGADEASTYLGAPGPGIVRCFAAGCDAQVGGYATDDEAIAEWNRRALAMDAAVSEAYSAKGLKHPEYAHGISDAELIREAIAFCDEELDAYEGMEYDDDCEVCCQRSNTFIRELVVRLERSATPAPQPQLPGIELAARFLEKRRDDYVREHGSFDPYTGATEFPGNGDEYVFELEEIIAGIRALARSEETGR